MNFNLGNREKSDRNKKVVGNLRRTQLITTHGPGSIVDFTEDSVIIAGINKWENYENLDYRINEHNLEKLLNVDYFVMPKVNLSRFNRPYADSRDIPAYRFPEMLFCNKCNRLDHYKNFDFIKKPKCNCGGKLVPSRFVVACENGHLDDFPYSWWAHWGNPEDCNNPHNLEIRTDDNSGGLESIIINCKSCKSYRTMNGVFRKNALSKYKCTGRKPWVGKDFNEECDQTMRTVQRGASNLYFPVHASALSIPPWSDKIQIEISNKMQLFKNIWDDDEVLETVIRSSNMHKKLGCSIKEIKQEIKRKMKSEVEEKSYKDIIEDEYKAFTRDIHNDEEFKTEREEVPEFISEYIDKVIQVRKLREVLAICGFNRIDPDYQLNDFETFTKLGRNYRGKDFNNNNWLPAIELRGEGIFIKFNYEKLREWEKKFSSRYFNMSNRLENSFIDKDNFSPRYVLLHSFSHLLIRQLILKCGYSSAALKERIYSTYPEDDSLEMAGVLIYTSTSDSDGSLGGLVKEGEKERLDNTLRNMLENASWCSSDPVCIQSTAQGIDSLNYAACHSCTLLPETSCEISNTLLDRASLVGNLEEEKIGFFNKLFTGDKN